MKFVDRMKTALGFSQGAVGEASASDYATTYKLPAPNPKRNLARYQRFNSYLTELSTVMDQGRRYILDPSFAVARDQDFHRKFWRELAIAKAVWTRATNVVGGEWHLEDADENSTPLTEAIEHIIKGISRFRESLLHMSLAFFSGGEWTKIEARVENTDAIRSGVPAHWWLPKRLRLMDRSRFHLEYDDDYDVTSSSKHDTSRRTYYWTIFNPLNRRTEAIPAAEMQLYMHHTWMDFEHSFGHGWGLAWALEPHWEIKQNLLKYLVTGARRFAWPWVIWKRDEDSEPVDSGLGAAAQTDRQIMAKLLKMQNLGNLIIDKDDDLTTLDLGTAGNGLIAQALDYVDKLTVEFILGSSAAVGGHGQQAQGGAYASDAVEADASAAYIGYDRVALEETMTEQLIGRIWRNNKMNFEGMGFGGMQPPIFRLGKNKRDDPLASIEQATGLSAIGFPIVLAQLAERSGWDAATEEQQANGEALSDPMADMGMFAPPPMADPNAVPTDPNAPGGAEEDAETVPAEDTFQAAESGALARRFMATKPKGVAMTNGELLSMFSERASDGR